jgi:hypothetical protein
MSNFEENPRKQYSDYTSEKDHYIQTDFFNELEADGILVDNSDVVSENLPTKEVVKKEIEDFMDEKDRIIESDPELFLEQEKYSKMGDGFSPGAVWPDQDENPHDDLGPSWKKSRR